MKQITKIIFASLLCIQLPLHAQLQTETREVLYVSEGQTAVTVIQPGSSFERKVTFQEKDYPVRRFLRVVGGIQMPGKFKPRGETLFREAEFLIDDNLDSLNTRKDTYSIYFKGENDPFERHAYNRITGVGFTGKKVTLEMNIKRNKLKVAPGGDFGVELQLYYKKEGRHPDEVYDRADSVIYIPVAPGSGNFRLMKQNLDIPARTASILVRVGGTNFSGECWVEAPRIYQDGIAVFESPFTYHEMRKDNYNYWVGINLATRSWPKWKLEFKGKTIFSGHIFDRASDIADFYIKLPEGLEGTGGLKLTLEKEPHRAAFPYELRSLQLMEESARDFEIVSVPKYANGVDTLALLLEVNRLGITLNFSAGEAIKMLEGKKTFAATGLHAVQFVILKNDVQVPIEISDGKEVRKGYVERIILKRKDNVYLSSGDEVHIDKEYTPYDYFFKWYIRERIGNWYHFRPSYQWSGVRITDENVIAHYTSLLNKMHIPYAWQVEGRTLAATRINPSLASLQSPMFRGKQAHENDGGYYYWQHFHYNGLHSDMAARTRPYGGIFAKHRPIYTDKGIFIHYDPYGVKDMQDGADKLVANLSYSRGESTRHTGPSTMFRYLYKAGYDWLGAEQMYGPEDIIMSSLRGASRAYNKENFGSLHAVQWGSFPFTDPKHALRFYLSLAVAYMHGSSHINTEEGLWTDEYSNDRFTESGKQHTYAQHQMLDYIETHSRDGELNTKIAVIQGRNDSWKSFGRTSVWSQNGDKWKFNKAQESFDLLKVFYPGSIVDACGPEGWFTSAPYGPVDILPIEASGEVMDRYKVMIFLGWNTFNNADFIRIKKYVEKGGTLVLTAAHLNSELQPDAPVQFPADDTVIKTILGLDYKSYKGKTIIPLGKGKVIYYSERTYPADETIRDSYAETMREVAASAISDEHEKGWVKASKDVDFTVWDSQVYRTIYMLNVDWKSDDTSRTATFTLNNYDFPVEINKYEIKTIRCKDKIAVMLGKNTSDIIRINENGKSIVIHADEGDLLTVFNGETGERREVNITSAGVQNIRLNLSR